jgi:cytochrome oxidase Cu insertion factor (SCO1/SenC/PrrC family)
MRRKTIMVNIILLFAAPLVAALLVYLGSDYLSLSSKSNGTLINPPLSLENLHIQHLNKTVAEPSEFAKHWWLIYLAPQHCTENCAIQVGKLRSVQLALNKNISRVKRVLLIQEESLSTTELQQATQDPQLTIDRISNPDYLQNHCPNTSDDGIFIMDPFGNIMLCYNATQEPHYILKDLEKLLKASQIG